MTEGRKEPQEAINKRVASLRARKREAGLFPLEIWVNQEEKELIQDKGIKNILQRYMDLYGK
jgi:hypothetical protein